MKPPTRGTFGLHPTARPRGWKASRRGGAPLTTRGASPSRWPRLLESRRRGVRRESESWRGTLRCAVRPCLRRERVTRPSRIYLSPLGSPHVAMASAELDVCHYAGLAAFAPAVANVTGLQCFANHTQFVDDVLGKEVRPDADRRSRFGRSETIRGIETPSLQVIDHSSSSSRRRADRGSAGRGCSPTAWPAAHMSSSAVFGRSCPAPTTETKSIGCGRRGTS